MPASRSSRGTFAKKADLPPSLIREVREAVEPLAGAVWPNPRWATDPVAFVREFCGDEPTEKQIEFLRAVRDSDHVAVRSGHKTGKTRTLVWLALWFFCCFEDARVLLTSATEGQVDKILWRELIIVLQQRRKKLAARDLPFFELDCLPAEHAKTGLIAPDKREIRGFSSREAEAVAGTSGRNVLYLVDEASGASETLFAAFEGNLAGGGKIVLASNPTRTTGRFFEVFTPKMSLENGGEWKCLHWKSTETPNAISGKHLVPGMATREWCEERAKEWGKTSAEYIVRVLGEFPTNEERRILTLHEVLQSQKRWDETDALGSLSVGIDVAGAGSGDLTAFAFRRGKKIIRLDTREKTTAADVLAMLLGFIRELKHESDREPVRACVDADGFGWPYFEHLSAYALEHRDEIAVIGVKAGAYAQREPGRFERVRDELFAAAEAWVKAGGALVPDHKLAEEAHAAEWISRTDGKVRATPKDAFRKLLGRSPDRWDAVCLAIWEEDNFDVRAAEVRSMNDAEAYRAQLERVPRLDPYSAERSWRQR